MCIANEKLKYFSYILSQLINLQRRKDLHCELLNDSEILNRFSNTRIMKFLYCLCLESVDIKRDFDGKDLFDIFDEFYAYRNGPVEVDVYGYLDIIPGFTYNNGRFENLIRNEVSVLNDENYTNLINKSIEGLNRMSISTFNDQIKLIEITHNMLLWKEAYVYTNDKKMDLSKENLELEYQKYAEITA